METLRLGITHVLDDMIGDDQIEARVLEREFNARMNW